MDWLDRFHGFLLVDKAAGMTSQDVITRLQRTLLTKANARDGSTTESATYLGAERNTAALPLLRKRDLPKMGHGGTLDPFATGLLVIAAGDGTKLARYLLDSEKTYEATVVFGTRTASGDLTNEVVERTDSLPTSIETLEAKAREFMRGPYLQIPPMYSAKKIDGRPLYELARMGIEVEREANECFVREFEVLDFEVNASACESTIRASVTGGTYIRTLAEDWAAKLGSLAHLRTLRRLRSGPFRIEGALSIEALAENEDWTTSSAFIPFDQCLREKLPSIEISVEESRIILEGKKSILQDLRERLPEGQTRVALYADGALRAVFARENGRTDGAWDFERVFPVR
jgi:tRNA pseudouridine55 synthase